MSRIVNLALAALLSLGSVSVPGVSRAADALVGTYEDSSVCGQPKYLSRIAERFDYQVKHVPNLPDVRIMDFQRVHEHRYLPRARTGRSPDAIAAPPPSSRMSHREVWYLIEGGWALPASARTWNSAFPASTAGWSTRTLPRPALTEGPCSVRETQRQPSRWRTGLFLLALSAALAGCDDQPAEKPRQTSPPPRRPCRRSLSPPPRKPLPPHRAGTPRCRKAPASISTSSRSPGRRATARPRARTPTASSASQPPLRLRRARALAAI